MSDYRRSHEGRIFFFTVVTHQRRPILTTDLGRQALRNAFRFVKEQRPFRLTAIVLLPDHLHTVWEFSLDDTDYSTRWRQIKSLFTREWLSHGGHDGVISRSRKKRGEQGIWQRRFYEHTCRDDDDLKRCVDYLHFNPLKHRLVERVQDWPYSSFHQFVRKGEYSIDWGGSPELYGDEFLEAE